MQTGIFVTSFLFLFPLEKSVYILLISNLFLSRQKLWEAFQISPMFLSSYKNRKFFILPPELE